MSSRLNSPRMNGDVNVEDAEWPVKVFSFFPFLSFTNWLVFVVHISIFASEYGIFPILPSTPYAKDFVNPNRFFRNSPELLNRFSNDLASSQTLSEPIESKSKFQWLQQVLGSKWRRRWVKMHSWWSILIVFMWELFYLFSSQFLIMI